MFEASEMLFIYVETPLHAGSGRGLGAVDLPIQRERATGYPIVQASGIKGRLRAEADDRARRGQEITAEQVAAIFGPETGNASDHAGALSVGDARLLLFPVRSLAGVFAWVTSVDVLARFRREAAMVGLDIPWEVPTGQPGRDEVWTSGDVLTAGQWVVLEEFSFQPRQEQACLVRAIGQWIADNALPITREYDYWRGVLPRKLCVLDEDAFSHFVQHGTEVQTHVRLDTSTKTVQSGALWTTESLPTDTLLYAPLMATKSRRNGTEMSAGQVLKAIRGLGVARTRLGGDETTGQGVVALRVMGGQI